MLTTHAKPFFLLFAKFDVNLRNGRREKETGQLKLRYHLAPCVASPTQGIDKRSKAREETIAVADSNESRQKLYCGNLIHECKILVE
jgi:hypothetical protein